MKSFCCCSRLPSFSAYMYIYVFFVCFLFLNLDPSLRRWLSGKKGEGCDCDKEIVLIAQREDWIFAHSG